MHIGESFLTWYVLSVSGGCSLMGTSRMGLNLLAVARWVRASGGDTQRSGTISWSISKHTQLVSQHQFSSKVLRKMYHRTITSPSKSSKSWLKYFQWSRPQSHFASVSISRHDLPSVQTLLFYLWVAVWKVLSWYTIHHHWNTSPVSYLRQTSSHRDRKERVAI